MEGQPVTLAISRPEAIVLFEFLSRFSNEDRLEIADQAEQRVLWNLCCDLEKTLAEPFDPDWTGVLKRARDEVRDKDE